LRWSHKSKSGVTTSGAVMPTIKGLMLCGERPADLAALVATAVNTAEPKMLA